MLSGDARIRPAQASDADAVFGLLTQFATSCKPQRDAFGSHYPVLLGADNADLLVAEIDDSVIGYALAFDMLTLFANGIVTELVELMVEPPYREQGIGSRLVGAIVERAKACGSIEVTVPTRRVAEFYTRLGFEETAEYFKFKV